MAPKTNFNLGANLRDPLLGLADRVAQYGSDVTKRKQEDLAEQRAQSMLGLQADRFGLAQDRFGLEQQQFDIDKANVLANQQMMSGLAGIGKGAKTAKDYYNVQSSAILGSNATPEAKRALLSDLTSRTKMLYPTTKSAVTPELSFKLAKEKQKVVDAGDVAQQKAKDYKIDIPKNMSPTAAIKYVDSKIKSIEAGKKKKSFNLESELYKNLSGKDDEDAEAVEAWLSSKEGKKILSMPKAKQKSFLQKAKSEYGSESSFDISDYFGGSAAGDVLGNISIK